MFFFLMNFNVTQLCATLAARHICFIKINQGPSTNPTPQYTYTCEELKKKGISLIEIPLIILYFFFIQRINYTKLFEILLFFIDIHLLGFNKKWAFLHLHNPLKLPNATVKLGPVFLQIGIMESHRLAVQDLLRTLMQQHDKNARWYYMLDESSNNPDSFSELIGLKGEDYFHFLSIAELTKNSDHAKTDSNKIHQFLSSMCPTTINHRICLDVVKVKKKIPPNKSTYCEKWIGLGDKSLRKNIFLTPANQFMIAKQPFSSLFQDPIIKHVRFKINEITQEHIFNDKEEMESFEYNETVVEDNDVSGNQLGQTSSSNNAMTSCFL